MLTLKCLGLAVALIAISGAADGSPVNGDEFSARQWPRFTRVVDGSIPQPLRLDFNRYHHYDEMTSYLRAVNAAYPQLTSLYSIGQSVQGKNLNSIINYFASHLFKAMTSSHCSGRELWVLLISSSPNQKVALQPEIKYVGNIHGNEPVGETIMEKVDLDSFLVDSISIIDLNLRNHLQVGRELLLRLIQVNL